MADEMMVEVTRGGHVESVHRGHVVVVNDRGEVLHGLGDPDTVIFPRSSCKMVQALPLVESGIDLSPERLALACASHQGAPIHVEKVGAWMDEMGLPDDAFRCGPQPTRDEDLHARQIREGAPTCRIHNNCSGKHAGFLALSRHLGAGPEYVEIDHPVQQAVRHAFEDVTGEQSPYFGIDGCSAPNFATSLRGLARAMARFATASGGSRRSDAMIRLREAMMAHPDLVAGEGRACTRLMRAMDGKAAIKTGAEGVFVAILPGLGLGVALKASDGATRAAEGAIAQVLVSLGVLAPDHPATRTVLDAPVTNWMGDEVGGIRAASPLAAMI